MPDFKRVRIKFVGTGTTSSLLTAINQDFSDSYDYWHSLIQNGMFLMSVLTVFCCCSQPHYQGSRSDV
jgi:hypothetical protein